MSLTVEEIAKRLGGAVVEGDASVKIAGLSDIREAQPGEIAFVANPRYVAAAAATRASAVIVSVDWKHPCPAALIRVKNPDKAFADVAGWFAPPAVEPEPGIHATAVIAANAKLGAGVRVGPYAVLEPGVDVGDNAIVSAQCYLGHGVVIGAGSKLYPQVSIREHCRLGRRCIVHNGAVIGSDGFGYVQEGEVRKKIPQIGVVVIGDDVEIGANVTIDRARFGQTRIGNGVKIDNLVQIAHNVVIGDNAVIVAQVGISGSTLIGDRTILAGQAGLSGHLVIGSDVIVGAQSGVHRDVPKGSYVLGTPAEPHERARKVMVLMGRLPEMREKLAALEARLAKLEAAAKPKG